MGSYEGITKRIIGRKVRIIRPGLFVVDCTHSPCGLVVRSCFTFHGALVFHNKCTLYTCIVTCSWLNKSKQAEQSPGVREVTMVHLLQIKQIDGVGVPMQKSVCRA